jgi:hypothetical protein
LGCDQSQQQFSDDAAMRFGEFTPHDMAECAGMYRAAELDGMAEIATAAAREAGRSVYGWTRAEAEAQIEEYRSDFALHDQVSESTSEQCGKLFGLMSRISEREREQ